MPRYICTVAKGEEYRLQRERTDFRYGPEVTKMPVSVRQGDIVWFDDDDDVPRYHENHKEVKLGRRKAGDYMFFEPLGDVRATGKVESPAQKLVRLQRELGLDDKQLKTFLDAKSVSSRAQAIAALEQELYGEVPA